MEAVDKLVPALDQILSTLQLHVSLQRVTTTLGAFVFIGVAVILAYDLTFVARARERMEQRIEQLSDANAELRVVADTLNEKVSATKRSIDATQKSVEQQPEIEIVPKTSAGGKPAGAAIVIHPPRVRPSPVPSAPSPPAPPLPPVEIPLQLPPGTTVVPPPPPQN